MKKGTLALLAIMLTATFGLAQDQLVFKAMKDEMKRNLDSLKKDGNSPFFISYALSDATVQSSGAVFGSLTHSDERQVKGWNSRVMVGDYQINDENYTDEGNYDVNYLNYPRIPLEDNYMAIRRFFWIATNNIFEEASRLYTSKMENLDRYDFDYAVPDFDKVPVEKIFIPNEVKPADLEEVDALLKEVSRAFNTSPNVFRSMANWNAVHGEIYFVNSEGTTYQVPYNAVSISVNTAMIDKEGGMLTDDFSLFGESPKEILDQKEVILTRIEAMIEAMTLKIEETEKIESYYGPVILSDGICASLFSQNLVTNELNTQRSPLAIQSEQQAINYFNEMKKQHEKEERLTSSDLSVYAIPKAKTYQDRPLKGTVIIDGEGVVPPDTIQLVKNGVLLEKLGTRTPGPKAMRSNGHYLNSLTGGNLFKSVSASNLVIESAKTEPLTEMKRKLIAKAKEDGFVYGLMISPAYEGSALVRYTKVYVDGREESFISTAPNMYQSNILKRVVASSKEWQVYHDAEGGGFGAYRSFSLVCPKFVMVNGFEISSGNEYGYNEAYSPSIPMPDRTN